MKTLFNIFISISVFIGFSVFAEKDTSNDYNSNPPEKVQHKLEDREKSLNRSEHNKDQDRAGKTIEEKRDIDSDGPRADAGEDTPSESQKPIPKQ